MDRRNFMIALGAGAAGGAVSAILSPYISQENHSKDEKPKLLDDRLQEAPVSRDLSFQIDAKFEHNSTRGISNLYVQRTTGIKVFEEYIPDSIRVTEQPDKVYFVRGDNLTSLDVLQHYAIGREEIQSRFVREGITLANTKEKAEKQFGQEYRLTRDRLIRKFKEKFLEIVREGEAIFSEPKYYGSYDNVHYGQKPVNGLEVEVTTLDGFKMYARDLINSGVTDTFSVSRNDKIILYINMPYGDTQTIVKDLVKLALNQRPKE